MQVKSSNRWYSWMENVFLSRLVIGPNYNNDSVRPDERLLAGDRNNLIMGKILLRQVRIRDESPSSFIDSLCHFISALCDSIADSLL